MIRIPRIHLEDARLEVIKKSLKTNLNARLARRPLLYRALLRMRRDPNKERMAYLRLVRNGSTVFDIGANTGYYTILFSHLVGPRGQVHAFEPVPPTFEILAKHLRMEQSFQNTFANCLAVSDSSNKSVRMFVPGIDYCQASLAVHNAGSWKMADRTEYEVQSISLDDYVRQSLVKDVHFIKCDIEGAELLALQGAAATLEKCKPIILFEYFEEWARHFCYSASDVIQHLEKYGYRHFYLEDFSELYDPGRQLENVRASVNVICSAWSLT